MPHAREHVTTVARPLPSPTLLLSVCSPAPRLLAPTRPLDRTPHDRGLRLCRRRCVVHRLSCKTTCRAQYGRHLRGKAHSRSRPARSAPDPKVPTPTLPRHAAARAKEQIGGHTAAVFSPACGADAAHGRLAGERYTGGLAAPGHATLRLGHRRALRVVPWRDLPGWLGTHTCPRARDLLHALACRALLWLCRRRLCARCDAGAQHAPRRPVAAGATCGLRALACRRRYLLDRRHARPALASPLWHRAQHRGAAEPHAPHPGDRRHLDGERTAARRRASGRPRRAADLACRRTGAAGTALLLLGTRVLHRVRASLRHR